MVVVCLGDMFAFFAAYGLNKRGTMYILTTRTRGESTASCLQIASTAVPTQLSANNFTGCGVYNFDFYLKKKLVSYILVHRNLLYFYR